MWKKLTNKQLIKWAERFKKLYDKFHDVTSLNEHRKGSFKITKHNYHEASMRADNLFAAAIAELETYAKQPISTITSDKRYPISLNNDELDAMIDMLTATIKAKRKVKDYKGVSMLSDIKDRLSKLKSGNYGRKV